MRAPEAPPRPLGVDEDEPDRGGAGGLAARREAPVRVIGRRRQRPAAGGDQAEAGLLQDEEAALGDQVLAAERQVREHGGQLGLAVEAAPELAERPALQGAHPGDIGPLRAAHGTGLDTHLSLLGAAGLPGGPA